MSGELQRRGGNGSKALVPQRASQPPAPSTTQPPAQTIPTLMREVVGSAVDVLQAHVQLAILEVREDAKEAGSIAAGFSVAAALAVLAIAFLGAGAAFGLALVLPYWAAFAIVGGVIAIAAAIVVTKMKHRVAAHDFTSERTIEMLEEGRKWLAERTDAPS